MATSLWARSGDLQIRKTVFEPATGATASFFVGGTTTPLVVFEDASESTPAGSVVTADGSGRWPSTYVPTGNSYDYRINDSDGTLITTMLEVPNPTVNSSVAPIVGAYETGDVLFRFEPGVRTGWVRLNGRTMGSAASAATERANDDTEDLFEYLWNQLSDTLAPVSGGRGASAAADFAANKTIQLPDARSALLRGVDDMGNTGRGELADTPVSQGDATTPGSTVGQNAAAISSGEMPSHLHAAGTLSAANAGEHQHGSGTIATQDGGAHTPVVDDPGHQHIYQDYRSTQIVSFNPSGTNYSVITSATLTNFADTLTTTGITIDPVAAHTHGVTGDTANAGIHGHTIDGSTAQTGSGSVMNKADLSLLGGYYIKL